MPISAAFTVNGVANPGEHAVAYGATVTLALTSITGASSIQWSVVGSSHADVPTPGITPAGSPAGATATFPFMSDPTGGEGRALIIKCLVSDGSNRLRARDEGVRWAAAYAVVGVPNAAGAVPFCVNEALYRSLTHGWVQRLNGSLSKPRVKCVQSGAQALTATVAAALVFDGADTWDTHGMHSPSVNNTRITFLVAGDYKITGNVKVDAQASVRLVLRKGGSTELAQAHQALVTNFHGAVPIVHQDRFAANEYIELIATSVTSVNTTPGQTHFAAHML